ncbi:MAG TPA: FAD-dependent oxidoreductase [Polyangiaceae bacterium]
MDHPIRIAIVGGGCAGVAAAFELSRPVHDGKYQVTLYQQGFRLGGKGASGRGPGDRIEEHGLHLWMGFYENAFRLMRECYAELQRDPKQCPIADWRDAFVPDPRCGVMDFSPDGNWLPWTTVFAPTPGDPGDPDPRAGWTMTDYLNRSVSLVLALMQAIQSGRPNAEPAGPPRAERMAPPAVTETMMRWLRFGELASLAGLIQAMQLLDNVVRTLPAFPRELILQFHAVIVSAAQRQLHDRTSTNDEARRLWEIIDLVLAVIRGIIRFGLITDPRGFEAIDEYDCREWLKLNGASDRSVDSAFLRALYDLAFAYEKGDVTRPRIAAGQALRGAVRAFFTYRGAFFWKMQAGMGDIVFAPFYEVLRQRGVRFEFFHRLTNVRLSHGEPGENADSSFVRHLDFDVQAEIAGADYQPLVDVRGLPCWPAQPDYRQLLDGANLQKEGVDFESHWEARRVRAKTLSVSEDFDFVVLAVGLGALPHVGKELIQHSSRWRDMLQHCQSVSTQAFQLWMSADMAELGWKGGPTNLSGFVEPFDTWADMSHLARMENIEPPPGAIAYFCSVLPDPPESMPQDDPGYPSRRREEVRINAVRFMNRDLVQIWPNATRAPDRFRWEVLTSTSGESAAYGESRFQSQFWTANVNPSDRYSLSLPGSLKYRISPLDPSFDNLTVAGDWTDCGFNEGCVEAAVMSGRLAAHALSKLPALADITGYDHP